MNYTNIKEFCIDNENISCEIINSEKENALMHILKYNKTKNIDASSYLLGELIKNSNLSLQDKDGNNVLMLYFANKKDQNLNIERDSLIYLLERVDLQQLNNSKRNALFYSLLYNKEQGLELTSDDFNHLIIYGGFAGDIYNATPAHYAIHLYHNEGLEIIEAPAFNKIIENSPNIKTDEGKTLWALLKQSSFKEEIAKKISSKSINKITRNSIFSYNIKSISEKYFKDSEIFSIYSYYPKKINEENVSLEQDLDKIFDVEEKTIINTIENKSFINKIEETVFSQKIDVINFDGKDLLFILNYFEKYINNEENINNIQKIKNGLAILNTNLEKETFIKFINEKTNYFNQIASYYAQINLYTNNFNKKNYEEQAKQIVLDSVSKFCLEIEQEITVITEKSLSSMQVLAKSFIK